MYSHRTHASTDLQEVLWVAPLYKVGQRASVYELGDPFGVLGERIVIVEAEGVDLLEGEVGVAKHSVSPVDGVGRVSWRGLVCRSICRCRCRCRGH